MNGRIRLAAALMAAGIGLARAQDAPVTPEEQAPAALEEQSSATLPVIPVEVTAPAEAQAATTEPDPSTVLETVQVTAQRKVSTVQKTPISLEAFNADKLQVRGISSLWGLASHVPSMTIEPFPTHNATLRMFIRGVGTADAQVTQDPAVGVYIDGVYIARSVGLAMDLADLERIEVLRGPQGTLYGRNTTGGAINLITRRPAPGPFSMAHQLTWGDRNMWTGKSSFNIPITDDMAAKLALLVSTQPGFVKNTGPGGDFGDRRQFATRFDLRWLPTEWLTADYSFDLTDMPYYNSQFQPVLPPNTNHGLAEFFKPFAAAQSRFSSERLDEMATGVPLEQSRSKVHGHSLTLAVPLGDFALKYIGAYRKLTDDEYVDLGGGGGSVTYRTDTHAYDGPSATMAYGGPTPLVIPQVFQDQWSHELQFSGTLFNRSVEFVAGAFHFQEKGGEHGRPLHHILNARIDPVQLQPVFQNFPLLEQLLVDLVSPNLVAYWDYELGIRNVAQALFAQATWTPPFWFGDRLHLTAGVRKSWDQREAVKDFIQRQYLEGRTFLGGLVAVPVPAEVAGSSDDFVNVHASRRDRDFSPSFNVQFDVTRNATAYASLARAYKSGGFNIRDPQVSGASGPASDGTNYGFGFIEGFKPEIVESVELGIKSEWLSRRLRLNAAVFDSDYKDMQTNFLISGTISDTKSRNVGKARMRGIEFDSTFLAARGLLLTFNYAYLNAEVLEVIDINGNNVASLYPFVSAPPQSYVGAIDWTFLQSGWGNLRAYASYNFVGKRIGTVITEERRGLTSIPGYGVLNARLGASGIHAGNRGSVEVGLWARNVLDEEYVIFAVDNLPHADRAVLWGEPRTIGVDLVYRWY